MSRAHRVAHAKQLVACLVASSAAGVLRFKAAAAACHPTLLPSLPHLAATEGGLHHFAAPQQDV
jgi:hypothetical protein